MYPLLRTLALVAALSAMTAHSQPIREIFGIKRTPESRQCELPMIYFEPGTIQLAAGYDLELRYLAHMMKKYRKMQIRLTPDLVPAPADVKERLLLEERLSYIVAFMQAEYKIDRDRFIREEYQNISRGYEAPVAPPPPLIRRRILCECVWD